MSTDPYEHRGINLYLFTNDIVPVDVGGLERSDFSQLGSWRIRCDGEMRTCGYIQRIAVKENFIDEHGDSSRLYILFAMLFSTTGEEVPLPKRQQINNHLLTLAKSISVNLSHDNEKATAVVLNPPQSLLEDLLKK